MDAGFDARLDSAEPRGEHVLDGGGGMASTNADIHLGGSGAAGELVRRSPSFDMAMSDAGCRPSHIAHRLGASKSDCAERARDVGSDGDRASRPREKKGPTHVGP